MSISAFTFKEYDVWWAFDLIVQKKCKPLIKKNHSFAGREEELAALCTAFSTSSVSGTPWPASDLATSINTVPFSSRFRQAAMLDAESWFCRATSTVAALVGIQLHGGKSSEASVFFLGSVGLPCRKTKSMWPPMEELAIFRLKHNIFRTDWCNVMVKKRECSRFQRPQPHKTKKQSLDEPCPRCVSCSPLQWPSVQNLQCYRKKK